MVPTLAVDEPGTWVNDQTALEGLLPNPRRELEIAREWFPSRTILDEFDPPEQTGSPDIPDDRQARFQLEKAALHEFGHSSGILDHAAPPEPLQHSQSCSARDGMSVVGESVFEMRAPFGDRPPYFLTCDHCAEREITAGDSLPQGNQVGAHPPPVEAEIAAESSKSGHHFVGDQQDSVSITELPDAGPVFVGWDACRQ